MALDVDGVLNALSDESARPVREVHIPAAALPDSPFVRRPEGDVLTVRLRLDGSDAVWIGRLREKADVVWATTWEHLANTVIAAELGIDPLEVAVTAEGYPPRFGDIRNGDSGAWKLEALAERYQRRHVVFVDDSVWHAPATGCYSMVVTPDGRFGLGRGLRGRVTRFVNRYSPSAD